VIDIRSLIEGAIKGELLFDEPLSRHTSLRVGGAADCLATPTDLSDLRTLVSLLVERGIPYMVLGGGYNLLVKDGGFRGVAISLLHFRRLERLPGNRLLVEAGILIRQLLDFCREEGLTGLEFLSWIPGTVGGALSMNAGAHGEAILERLESLTTTKGDKVTLKRREELSFGYRYLAIDPGEIVLSATFSLSGGSAAQIERRIEEFLAHRRSAQQVGFPSAGSFFRNPPGNAAWRLIDAVGLRGKRIGGAQVSEVHANFLVNRGGATAADFLALAQFVKEKVKANSGIELEEEVRIVGEDGGAGS
jgi:UDP-N-acetylmuramate dehydrogenase